MRQNILATLAFYDALDMPLKREEIFRFLIKINPDDNKVVGQLEIEKTVAQLLLEGNVRCREGHYFLFDKEYLVPLRQKKKEISEKKMSKAKKAVRWLAFLPFVRAVFTSGSLTFGNCDELSDLDILVVAKKGRIWTCRLLVSGKMSILGVRRKWFQKIAPDKICLNHYITDESLAIQFENIYNAQTYLNLKLLLAGDKNIVANFYRENEWLKKHLFFYEPTESSKEQIKVGFLARVAVVVGEWILNSKFGEWLENRARDYQTRRIEKNPLSKNPSGHIVYSNEQLAFHPDSPADEILRKYELNLEKIKNAE